MGMFFRAIGVLVVVLAGCAKAPPPADYLPKDPCVRQAWQLGYSSHMWCRSQQ